MTNNEEETKGETADNSREGFQQEAVSELDRADQIAERQKRENDRREELLQREEALQARKTVGGVTEAGQTKEKPKEETPQEYAKKVMANQLDG